MDMAGVPVEHGLLMATNIDNHLSEVFAQLNGIYTPEVGQRLASL